MSDFIVTVHALDRMHERYPGLVEEMDDDEIAALMHREIMAAIDNGRQAKVAPAILRPRNNENWQGTRKGASFVWNENQKRGYVIQEGEDGLLVLTVLQPWDEESPSGLRS